MSNPLMQTIEALAKEKGIEADVIISAIEDAVSPPRGNTTRPTRT